MDGWVDACREREREDRHVRVILRVETGERYISEPIETVFKILTVEPIRE